MPATRAAFAAELDPSLRTIFFDRYDQEPQVMPKVFNVLTSDMNMETDSATTGFGLMQQTSELGALDYEDPIKMYQTTYTHLKYTKGFKVSEELVDDDQHNVIKRMPAALGKSAARTSEFYAANTFNNGFDTDFTSYGDARPLFSTSHTRADGGTAQSNASATSIALTETNLETARLAAEKLLDDKGQIVNFQMSDLLIPLDLRKTAMILSKSEMRPGGNNNDINIYQGIFNVIPWRYITSTTAWFLLDSGNHLLNFFWRQRPEFKSDYSFDSDAALYKAKMRFSVGWSDYRGVWGSQGNAAAYAD